MKKTLAGMATLALLFFLPMFSVYAAGMSLSADQQWIDGLSANIEYITEETYKVQSADTANNPHWTSLSGGTRPNGTKYASFWLVEGHKLQVASAWYGKNIYFRPKGTTGKGTVIAVPDYSQLKEPYKKAIRIFNAYPSDTGDSFYASYLRSISDKNSYLSETIEKVNIDISMASIVNFNKAPNNYLTDAEGNYIYDLVAIGANVLEEPDLSGAAAWALKEYIRDGYGFLVGHDTMYGYGGVNSNPNYVPDKSSTVTPIYELNTNNNGHWNMNWLMGVNKLYTESHPYDAASLILNLGDWHDKSTLYGDTTEKVSISTVRIAAKSQGSTTDNVTARCPTNYPYNSTVAGNLFSVGSNIFSGATHTNQQLAYGKVWIDFVSNTSDGKLIVDKNGGMIGTNNFYLTTNGNFGMMQIGHSKDNLTAARPDEARILANTILYLSQREPCGVCQSKQDSNTVVHSVKRISSAAELANIGNSAMWYTYPLSGCYVLTDDIVLPTDWKPIENFCGHFNADGHDITANGKAVFAQNGVLGANLGGWNLGINPDKGINRIASGNGTTTATARVVGHLNQLFGTDSSTDYSLYNVKIAGSDGKEYDCVTNREGKYIVSNVPCTGKKMVAKVFDSTGREITEYGGIYAQVKQDAWNTNETVPMQLTRNGLRPVPNQIIYEDEDAVFVGGINSQTLPQKTKWQYRGGAGDTWKNVEDSTFFECEISSVEMVAADTPYAQTKLTIKNAQLTIDKLQFRAVFTLSGEEYNTFDAKTENAAGLLRVKEQPYKLSPIKNVNTWQGETVDLVVDFEYYRKMHNPAGCGWWHGAPIFFTPNCQFPQELEVRWQYRGNKDCTWENLDDSPIITDYKAWTSYYEVTGKPTEQLGYKSNAFLRLNNVSTDINGYEFRAILEYKQKSRVFSTDSVATADAVGRVTVRPKLIQCVAQPKNLKAQTNGSTALGTYEYATEFEYVAPTPYINVVWEYKTNAADTYKDIKTFPYQNVAATHVNISTEVSPNVYRVKAILTLTNPPNDLDIGRNHFYFRAKATSNSILGYSNSADFSLNYKVDIKPGTPVVRMSADGQTKVYTYPSLTVFAPEGVRNFQVSFAPDSMAAKNKMASPQNLGGSAALAADKGFIYNSNTSLSARTVRDFLRQVQITVSSEKANVKWYISSERFAGEFDPYSGKYYEYVAAPGTTWTQSFDAARNRYHNALQAQGKLATIKNNEQNNLVQRLVGSSYAWIGATNDRGYLPCENWGQYLWVDGSALSYDRLTSKPSGNNYAQMQPSGAWLAARNTQSSTATVTDLINYNGYEHGGWYVKSGIFQGTTPEGTNNNQGYTGLLLLAPDSTWGVDTIVAHSVYLENGHLYWVSGMIGEYGDSNGNMILSTPFGTIWSYWHSGPAYINQVARWTGASGNYEFEARTNGNGPNHSGVIGQLYHLEVVNLTQSFEHTGMQVPTAQWLQDNVGVFNGSKSIQFTSNQSDTNGYVVEYVVNDNAAAHTEKSARANDLLFGGKPTPPPTPVPRDAEYRTDTDVLFSCSITALEPINPDNPASVTFKISDQNSTMQTIEFTDVCMPINGVQRAYVPYHIADAEGAIRVEISTTPNIASDTSIISGNVIRLQENIPPDTKATDRNDSFLLPQVPTFENVLQHAWKTYVCENVDGDWQYTEKEHQANLRAALQVQPDAQVPTADGKNMKSGYGVNINLTAQLNMPDCIAPQTSFAFFPEFRYAGYSRQLAANKINANQIAFRLKENPYSQVNARVHFTPLWYPDKPYKVFAYVRDFWTPVGELKQSVTDTVEISGSVYDDWYIAKSLD